MKKQTLVAAVGTFALAANLIIPGLAFSQAGQEATVAVGCPEPGPFEFVVGATPADVTLTNLTAGSGGNSVDSSISVDAPSTVSSSNILALEDRYGSGAEGCSPYGGSIVASATNFTDIGGSGNTISNAKLRMVTTTNINPTDNGSKYSTVFGGTPTVDVTNGVIYSDPAGTGNVHDATASLKVADPAAANLADPSNITDYRLATNTLDGQLDVIGYCTPKNTVLGLSTALALENIESTQPSGTYRSTVTYTKSQVDCNLLSSGTLTSAIDEVQTSFTVQATEALAANYVILVDSEYMLITAATDAGGGLYSIDVTRGYKGSIRASHTAGTDLYTYGVLEASDPSVAYDEFATTIEVTDARVYTVGQTIESVQNGEHLRIIDIPVAAGTTLRVERGTDGTRATATAIGSGFIKLGARI